MLFKRQRALLTLLNALDGSVGNTDFQKLLELDRIQQWIESDEERIALTCYELLPKQCHRRCVADALEPRMGTATIHL